MTISNVRNINERTSATTTRAVRGRTTKIRPLGFVTWYGFSLAINKYFDTVHCYYVHSKNARITRSRTRADGRHTDRFVRNCVKRFRTAIGRSADAFRCYATDEPAEDEFDSSSFGRVDNNPAAGLRFYRNAFVVAILPANFERKHRPRPVPPCATGLTVFRAKINNGKRSVRTCHIQSARRYCNGISVYCPRAQFRNAHGEREIIADATRNLLDISAAAERSFSPETITPSEARRLFYYIYILRTFALFACIR